MDCDYWDSDNTNFNEDVSPKNGGHDLLINKFDVSERKFDGNALDDYFRGSLKDKSPEPEIFDSEGKRDNTEARRTVLNMRYGGSRSVSTPDHSEVFLGFMDKDPRGTSTAPDFREFNNEMRERFRIAPRSVDSETNSITSGVMTEQERRENMKMLNSRLKDTMKWFTTSYDGK